MLNFYRLLAFWLVACCAPAMATLVDIKANGSDGPLTVAVGDEVQISVRLEPDGALQGQPSDWWLAASTGGAVFFYSLAGGWSNAIVPVVQLAPASLPLTQILTLPPLPEGSYTLFFGLDADADASPSPVALDAVTITVRALQQLPPSGAHLIQIAAGASAGSARFTWLAATDRTTVASAMVYQLHVGETESFTPSEATLKVSVTGLTETDVLALPTGQTLYARVVAIDGEGNVSTDGATLPFQAAAASAVLGTNTKLRFAEELGLGTATLSGTTFSVAKSASTQTPETGTILSATDASGTPYLGRVSAVREDAGVLRIDTTPVALAQVYASAGFNATVRLDDLATSASASNLGVRSARSGSVQLHAGAVHAPTRVQLRDASASTSVRLESALAFTPSLTYDFLWQSGALGTSPAIEKAEIALIGDFKAETRFAFDFQAAANYEKEFDITLANSFPRRFQSRMFIGNIPVLVDVDLSLKGKVSASARSAIQAQGLASYQRRLSLAMRYDPQLQAWVTNPSTEFSRELTVALKAQGEVVGELRLIPNIQARFNKVLAIGASIEPFLSANASIEAVAGANLLTGSGVALTQPTVFDVTLGAECKAYVNLELLVTTIPLLSGTVCGPYQYPLFTLPKLELTAPQGLAVPLGQSLPLTFATEDGTHDAVDLRSLRFEAYPKDKRSSITVGATATPAAGKRTTELTFTACDSGPYTLYASAFGKLGEVGRQYQVALLEAGAEGACTPVAHMLLDPEIGPSPLQVQASAAGSSVPFGNIARYQWTTSDGQQAEGVSASFSFSNVGVYAVTLTITAADGQRASSTETVTVADCFYYGPNTHYKPGVSLQSALTAVYERGCSASTGTYKVESTDVFRPDGQALSAYLKVSRVDDGTSFERQIEWGDLVPGSALPTTRLVKSSYFDVAAADWARLYTPATILAAARGVLPRSLSYNLNLGDDWRLEHQLTAAADGAGSFGFSCNQSGDGRILTSRNAKPYQLDTVCRATTTMVPIVRPVADKRLWSRWP